MRYFHVLYKINSFAIFAIVSVTLTLVLIASLVHYSQVAVAKSNKAKSNIVDGTVSAAGGDSSGINTDLAGSNNRNNLFPSNQKTTTISSLPSNNLNSLTSKELKSFSKCIDTANKIQGISGRIVTGCLDTSKGLTSTPDTTQNMQTGSNSNNLFPTNQTTTISSLPSNNLNSLTSKELKSFSKCIDTANELHAASHAVFTGCLDEAKGRMY